MLHRSDSAVAAATAVARKARASAQNKFGELAVRLKKKGWKGVCGVVLSTTAIAAYQGIVGNWAFNRVLPANPETPAMVVIPPPLVSVPSSSHPVVGSAPTTIAWRPEVVFKESTPPGGIPGWVYERSCVLANGDQSVPNPFSPGTMRFAGANAKAQQRHRLRQTNTSVVEVRNDSGEDFVPGMMPGPFRIRVDRSLAAVSTTPGLASATPVTTSFRVTKVSDREVLIDPFFLSPGESHFIALTSADASPPDVVDVIGGPINGVTRLPVLR